MLINDQSIDTPEEDQLLAKPCWRAYVASAYAYGEKRGRYPAFVDDYIRSQIRYLNHNEDSPYTGVLAHYDKANRWEADFDLGSLIRAYLVSGLPVNEIASELGVSPEAIDVFEKVWFDVLDENRIVRASALHHVDEYMPPPREGSGLLIAAALHGGPELLRRVHGIPTRGEDEDLLGRLVNTEQIKRVLRGDMPNSDLARISNTLVSRQKMLHDTGQNQSRVMEGYNVALRLLSAMAPEMVPPELKTEEARVAADSELRAKLAVRKEIDQQRVQRTGERDAAIDDMLKDHLKAPAEKV